MIKVAALLLVTISLASAVELESSNFNGVKTFLHGFLNGFEQTTTTQSSDCLSETFQSKLDEDFILIFSSLIRFKIEDVFTYLHTLLVDLESMSTNCGLNVVLSSYEAEYNTFGAFALIKNLAVNFLNITASFAEIFVSLVEEDWLTAGNHLGTMVQYVIPYHPQ